MTKKEIKDILLKVAGYPVSGGVKEIVDAQAEALAEALKPAKPEPKQTRVIEPEETR
mgnify:CR=1 FL=1